MSQVLISNAKRLKSGRVEKETGTLRYLLQQEIKVPMALADQKPEHFEYRARVDVFNRELTAHVQEKGHDVDQHIGHLYQQVPGLLGNSLLDIHLITDSRGQHKDERSKARDNTAVDVEYEDVTEHVSRPDTLTGDDEDYDYNPLDMNFSR